MRPIVVASVVLVRFDIGVPQGAASAGELGKQKDVLAMDVGVVTQERRQPGDVLVGGRLGRDTRMRDSEVDNS